MEDGHQLGPGGGAFGGEGVLGHPVHEAGFLGVLDRAVEPVLLVHVLEGHRGGGVFRILLQGEGVEEDHLAVRVAGVEVVAVHQAGGGVKDGELRDGVALQVGLVVGQGSHGGEDGGQAIGVALEDVVAQVPVLCQGGPVVALVEHGGPGGGAALGVQEGLVGVAVVGGLQDVHAAVGFKAVPQVGVGVEDHVHVVLLQEGLHAVGQVVLGQGVVVDGHGLPGDRVGDGGGHRIGVGGDLVAPQGVELPVEHHHLILGVLEFVALQLLLQEGQLVAALADGLKDVLAKAIFIHRGPGDLGVLAGGPYAVAPPDAGHLQDDYPQVPNGDGVVPLVPGVALGEGEDLLPGSGVEGVVLDELRFVRLRDVVGGVVVAVHPVIEVLGVGPGGGVVELGVQRGGVAVAAHDLVVADGGIERGVLEQGCAAVFHAADLPVGGTLEHPEEGTICVEPVIGPVGDVDDVPVGQNSVHRADGLVELLVVGCAHVLGLDVGGQQDLHGSPLPGLGLEGVDLTLGPVADHLVGDLLLRLAVVLRQAGDHGLVTPNGSLDGGVVVILGGFSAPDPGELGGLRVDGAGGGLVLAVFVEEDLVGGGGLVPFGEPDHVH